MRHHLTSSWYQKHCNFPELAAPEGPRAWKASCLCSTLMPSIFSAFFTEVSPELSVMRRPSVKREIPTPEVGKTQRNCRSSHPLPVHLRFHALLLPNPWGFKETTFSFVSPNLKRLPTHLQTSPKLKTYLSLKGLLDIGTQRAPLVCLLERLRCKLHSGLDLVDFHQYLEEK